MSEPTRAGDAPIIKTLEPGTYYWCSCGEANPQPFCDKSHEGTVFAPIEFSIDEPKEVALCACKRTNSPPYCDGSHKNS